MKAQDVIFVLPQVNIFLLLLEAAVCVSQGDALNGYI